MQQIMPHLKARGSGLEQELPSPQLTACNAWSLWLDGRLT